MTFWRKRPKEDEPAPTRERQPDEDTFDYFISKWRNFHEDETCLRSTPDGGTRLHNPKNIIVRNRGWRLEMHTEWKSTPGSRRMIPHWIECDTPNTSRREPHPNVEFYPLPIGYYTK